MVADNWLDRLKDPRAQVRSAALDECVAAWRAGRVSVKPQSDLVNLHCHTCFSYNAYGHSPSSLAWLARAEGWRAIATVDFDVLDGVEETLAACGRVEVRGAAGVETRAHLAEFADREINSPGEPGVLYHVGVGFTGRQAPEPARAVLDSMWRRAADRNRDMVARINAHLDAVVLDYDRDVLPLTPAGNATERHILIAYDIAARRRYSERAALVSFWAGKLGADVDQVDRSLEQAPGPNELVRARLMKRGSVGYVQPGPATFPSLDEVTQAIIACGAIPVYAWLDGTSQGEQSIEELLTLLIGKGVAGINIIPDRNWNIPDPKVRAAKVRELYAVVDLARSLDFPIIVGTEMNKAGQPLVDDLSAEPLRPLRENAVHGAHFLYGHTVMQRALGLGYESAWARTHLAARRARNAFYVAVGQAVEPGAEALRRVRALGPSLSPEAIVARLEAR
jgi:hypothetical protein